MQERHQRHAEDDHRDRQPEVELHEAHAVGRALPRGADHGDGRELRRHDGQADRPPGEVAAGEEVALDVVGPLRAPQAVPDHVHEVHDHDEPVDPVHGA